MKKITAFIFVLGLAVTLPVVAQAADDCGCATNDVTCINNCTLSKVSSWRKNIETKKQNAKAQAKALKNNQAQKSTLVEDTKAQAKAQAQAKREEAQAKAAQAKADVKARKEAAKAKAEQAKADAKAQKEAAKQAAKDSKAALKAEKEAWKNLAK